MISIEDILSSRGRVRILKLLLEQEELNISAIMHKCALNYSAVVYHLGKLVEAGLVKEKRFGKIRIFKIDKNNPVNILLSRVFESLNRIDSSEYKINDRY